MTPATVDTPGVAKQRPYIGPHGNVCVARGKLPSTDLAQNNTVDFARVPKGAVILDVQDKHSAFGASVTFDLGLVAENAGALGGVDFLIDGADIAAAGIIRQSEVGKYANPDFTLDDDYRIRGTFLAANPDAGVMEVTVYYEFPGLA
jgi:hypothetical protein